VNGVSEVDADDLNDIQDNIIGAKRPPRPRHHPVLLGRQIVGASGVLANGSFTSGGTTDVFTVPLVMNGGERITSIQCVVNPAASGAITATLIRIDDAAESNLARGDATSSGAALQTLTITPTGGFELVPSDGTKYTYAIQYTFTTTTGHQVRGVYVISDVL
jgi:hypothetical protein